MTKLFKPWKMEIEITFISNVLGATPKNEDVFKKYIEIRAKGKETKEATSFERGVANIFSKESDVLPRSLQQIHRDSKTQIYVVLYSPREEAKMSQCEID